MYFSFYGSPDGVVRAAWLSVVITDQYRAVIYQIIVALVETTVMIIFRNGYYFVGLREYVSERNRTLSFSVWEYRYKNHVGKLCFHGCHNFGRNEVEAPGHTALKNTESTVVQFAHCLAQGRYDIAAHASILQVFRSYIAVACE